MLEINLKKHPKCCSIKNSNSGFLLLWFHHQHMMFLFFHCRLCGTSLFDSYHCNRTVPIVLRACYCLMCATRILHLLCSSLPLNQKPVNSHYSQQDLCCDPCHVSLKHGNLFQSPLSEHVSYN